MAKICAVPRCWWNGPKPKLIAEIGIVSAVVIALEAMIVIAVLWNVMNVVNVVILQEIVKIDVVLVETEETDLEIVVEVDDMEVEIDVIEIDVDQEVEHEVVQIDALKLDQEPDLVPDQLVMNEVKNRIRFLKNFKFNKYDLIVIRLNI